MAGESGDVGLPQDIIQAGKSEQDFSRLNTALTNFFDFSLPVESRRKAVITSSTELGSNSLPIVKDTLLGTPQPEAVTLYGQLLSGLAKPADTQLTIDSFQKLTELASFARGDFNATTVVARSLRYSVDTLGRLAYIIRSVNPEDPRLKQINDAITQPEVFRTVLPAVAVASSITGIKLPEGKDFKTLLKDVNPSDGFIEELVVNQQDFSRIRLNEITQYNLKFDSNDLIRPGDIQAQIEEEKQRLQTEKPTDQKTDVEEKLEPEDQKFLDQIVAKLKDQIRKLSLFSPETKKTQLELVNAVSLLGPKGLQALETTLGSASGEERERFTYAKIINGLAQPDNTSQVLSSLDTTLTLLEPRNLNYVAEQMNLNYFVSTLQRLAYVMRSVNPDDPRLTQIAENLAANINNRYVSVQDKIDFYAAIATTGQGKAALSAASQDPIISPEDLDRFSRLGRGEIFPDDIDQFNLLDGIYLKASPQNLASQIALEKRKQEEGVSSEKQPPEKLSLEQKIQVRLLSELVQEALLQLQDSRARILLSQFTSVEGKIVADQLQRFIVLNEFGNNDFQVLIRQELTRSRFAQDRLFPELKILWLDRQAKKVGSFLFADEVIFQGLTDNLNEPSVTETPEEFLESWDSGYETTYSPSQGRSFTRPELERVIQAIGRSGVDSDFNNKIVDLQTDLGTREVLAA